MENNNIDIPNFLPYNTDMKPMRMPEYGRKIHELIEYCKLIEDREERTACAYAIAEVMARLFPQVISGKNDRKKIWDHINIMAGFELDVDFPLTVITREELNPKPKRPEYSKKPIFYRHYGRTIEMMIQKLVEMEPGEQRDQLTLLIANQMKKQLLAHNKEVVSDAKVLKDLAEFSGGAINLKPEEYPLHEYSELVQQNQGKKKKRK